MQFTFTFLALLAMGMFVNAQHGDPCLKVGDGCHESNALFDLNVR